MDKLFLFRKTTLVHFVSSYQLKEAQNQDPSVTSIITVGQHDVMNNMSAVGMMTLSRELSDTLN